MENMVGYIFGSLKNNDDAIRGICKALRNQTKINRRFLVCSLATVGWLYLVDKRLVGEKKELEKRIDKMEAEIKELKTEKGEHTM